MRRLKTYCLMFVALLCAMSMRAADGRVLSPTPPAAGKPGSSRPLIVEIMMHDTLQQVSAENFRSTMQAANARKPAAILVNLSTPGGVPASAAAMAEVIEHSRAPVIVFMREQGTHVSGEGLQLLQAGDVRVMSSGTALQPSLAVTEIPKASTLQDSAALLAALQESALRHGRPTGPLPALLESTEPVSATDALGMQAIDMIVPNEEHLLDRLNGVTIHRANGETAVLHLRDGFIANMPMTLREHMMRALMNPDLTVLLLALGGLLLYLEINTPGGVVPGAAGLLLVLLAVYALMQMPLRWEGLLLLAVAGLLLLLEAYFQRGKWLAVFAMLTLVVGLRMLVRAPIPEMEVNWGTAIGAGVGFGGITAGLLLLGLKARRSKVRTGAEAMLGWFAVTHTPLAPEGEILVRGELWRARLSGSDAFLAAGESVKVEGARGAVLDVAPLPNLQGNA